MSYSIGVDGERIGSIRAVDDGFVLTIYSSEEFGLERYESDHFQTVEEAKTFAKTFLKGNIVTGRVKMHILVPVIQTVKVQVWAKDDAEGLKFAVDKIAKNPENVKFHTFHGKPQVGEPVKLEE